MKYKLHIGYCSRPDLAFEAAHSARDIGNIHMWSNGCPPGDFPEAPFAEHHALPLLANVGVINHFIQSSWDDDVMFWMHNDGWAKPGFAARFLTHIKEWAPGERWGVVFTLYDILCCFNMKAVRDIGYWDPMYMQYSVDIDYYHHMLMKDWSIHTFGRDQVLHRDSAATPEQDQGGGGSHTVRSDPTYNHRIKFRERDGFDNRYFQFKWGTPKVGYETDRKLGYRRPFENFDPAQAPPAFDDAHERRKAQQQQQLRPQRRPSLKA